MRASTALGTLLRQNGASLEKATWARLIRCCIAVIVGCSQETWDPKYLHPVMEGTGDPSENSRGVARVFECFRCSVFVRSRENP